MNMPRMKILNSVEQEEFDVPPIFNSVHRKRYFDFPIKIYHIAENFRTPTNRVYFLIGCGYFKATKKFFPAPKFHQRDVDYVAKELGFLISDIFPATYDKQTRLRHQKQILDFYGFKPFGEEAKLFICREIEGMAHSHLRPKFILFRAVDILVREKFEVPRYFQLAEIILKAINSRKKSLSMIIEKALNPETKKLLDSFLIQSTSLDGGPSPSKTTAYKLTLLKKLSQSTKPSKIKKRVSDLQLIRDLYFNLQPILNVLNLNYEGIRYFAHSVIKSEIFQVARRADEDRYLHMIAFIAHQYFRLQDNLVDSLLSSLQSYLNSSHREHKEKCYEHRQQKDQSIKEFVNCLDEGFFDVLTVIKAIIENENLGDDEKIQKIKAILIEKGPTRKYVEEWLAPLKKELEGELKETDYYRILEARSKQIQNRISPILKEISFQEEQAAEKLMEAIRFFKDKGGTIDATAPTDFLKPEEREAMEGDDGKFRVSLYKAFLFIHVKGAIKSGTLNLQHSYKYRTLDHYLINRKRWQKEKEILLERAGLQKFSSVERVLKELEQMLHTQYVKTNQNILKGKNKYVTFTKDESIRINTPKQDDHEIAPEPLHEFFPEKQYISLLEVLFTVNKFSGFLNEFQHWQQRYNRPKPPPKTFFAGIVGLGCGIGTRKIAKISREINEAELDHTVNWYFSGENTLAANDKVLRFMDRMELPNIYRNSMRSLHTSSDGQKFEVRADSLNANYSFKYFGKGQGVSVYSFIDERNLLFYSTVISSAERESAYVIDGLMHNDVIKSDIHSTDSHGFSEIIFGVMHLLGFSYAPRIKGLKRQRLYCFKSRKGFDRSWFKVVPSGYIDEQLIGENWDDIIRFITTIKIKEATASDLFRRLNSYSKQHSLYRSLKVFGKIIKSIFILRYIDDLELRQAIEKQLNKIESSHRFSRAISVGNPREFTQAEKSEQEIAEGCKRLIKNAIICWNYLYLTKKIDEANNQQSRESIINALAAGSVVSWQHINLLGEYDFSEEKLQDSVGIIAPKNLTAEAL